ncbi:MAG: hypothetical protein KJZ52_02240, partial [Anaerolineales bacterium]|nr:hypothetical protein [Anaerolineales bacterium]
MTDQLQLTPEMLVPRMGEYLIRKGVLSPEGLQKALTLQQDEATRGNRIMLGDALVQLKLIERNALNQAIT